MNKLTNREKRIIGACFHNALDSIYYEFYRLWYDKGRICNSREKGMEYRKELKNLIDFYNLHQYITRIIKNQLVKEFDFSVKYDIENFGNHVFLIKIIFQKDQLTGVIDFSPTGKRNHYRLSWKHINSTSYLPSYIEAGEKAKKYSDFMNSKSEKPNGFHELDFYNGANWVISKLKKQEYNPKTKS